MRAKMKLDNILLFIVAVMLLYIVIMATVNSVNCAKNDVEIVSVLIREDIEERTAILFYSDNTYDIYEITWISRSWNTKGMYQEISLGTYDNAGKQHWIDDIDSRKITYLAGIQPQG